MATKRDTIITAIDEAATVVNGSDMLQQVADFTLKLQMWLDRQKQPRAVIVAAAAVIIAEIAGEVEAENRVEPEPRVN